MSTEFSLLVVSNRLPFTVRRDVDGGVRRVPAAGGLVTAVAPVVIQTKGNIYCRYLRRVQRIFRLGRLYFREAQGALLTPPSPSPPSFVNH